MSCALSAARSIPRSTRPTVSRTSPAALSARPSSCSCSSSSTLPAFFLISPLACSALPLISSSFHMLISPLHPADYHRGDLDRPQPDVNSWQQGDCQGGPSAWRNVAILLLD